MLTPDLNRIYGGDCREVMASWPDTFVDTVITDPPYGLQFMGKDWDDDVPGEAFWREMLRVCKPGALLLSFGGTRTWHHLAMAIEKAGWQIRDCLMWLYGSGFPKSLDISKAIDKAKGHWRGKAGPAIQGDTLRSLGQHYEANPKGEPITATATAWRGYGTALKPAWEPIILAMKPLDGTFAENAEKWGVAGLNVDGGRIGTDGARNNGRQRGTNGIYGEIGATTPVDYCKGRWPANLLLDEEAAAMLDGVSGASVSKESIVNNLGSIWGSENQQPRAAGHNDSGGASRFFYVAKSARSERNEGCDELPEVEKPLMGEFKNNPGRTTPKSSPTARANHHPTVKPLELMKYLCNLTRTPTGGIVLDAFCGSGTTLWAAECHNRPWIGIEINPEYVAIAEARIARERSQMKIAI